MTTLLTRSPSSAPAQPRPAPGASGVSRLLVVVLLPAGVLLGKLLWFDHQVAEGGINGPTMAADVATVLVLTCWLPLLRPARRLLATLSLSLLLSLLILADLLYFRFFGGLLTVPILLQVGQVGAVEGSIVELAQLSDLVLLADLPVLVYLGWRARRQRRAPVVETTPAVERLRQRLAVSLSVLAVVAPLSLQLVSAQRSVLTEDLFRNNWWDVPIYHSTGLVGFHAYDAYRFGTNRLLRPEPSEAELETVVRRYQAGRESRPTVEGAPAFGQFRGSNVLVVQVEALQSFALGRTVAGTAITPNLDRLAKRSVHFTDAHHQTASGRTSDAELLAGCSLHAAATGAVFARFSGNDFDCVPEVLRGHGYATASHHAFNGSFWNRNGMYPSMGYERFHTIDDYENTEPLGWSIGDRSFLRQTVGQLSARGRQPFYDVAITLTSHHPYDTEHLPVDLDLGTLDGSILGNYLETVHYLDAAIGELVTELERVGLWDDTVVVLYGDHDSRIPDKDLYGTLFDRAVDEDELQRLSSEVPMMIHLPDDAYAGRIDAVVGQIDLPPTLYHLLGVPLEKRYVLGRNAFAAGPRRVVFRNGGFVDDEVFYSPSAGGSPGQARCTSRRTGRPVDAGACREGAESAQADLAVSDLMIENDLLPDLD